MQNYQTGLQHLASYPKAQLYRLIVEGHLLKKEGGYQDYEEREPGSLAAFFKALGFAIQNFHCKDLSPSFISQLHFYCSKVENITPKNIPGEYRTKNYRVWFGLTRKLTTKEGIIDLLNFIQNQQIEGDPLSGSCIMQGNPKTNYRILFYFNKDTTQEKLLKMAGTIDELIDSGASIYYLASEGSTVLENKLFTTIANYNQSIRSANNTDETIKIIVDTVYDIYHHHPFPDVNLRTIVLLLMDFLLMQNGLPPPTLETPFNFNGHSKTQLLQDVKKGIEDTRSLIGGTKLLHGFDASVISDQDTKFAELISSFCDILQNELNKNPKHPLSYLFNEASKTNNEPADLKPTISCEEASSKSLKL